MDTSLRIGSRIAFPDRSSEEADDVQITDVDEDECSLEAEIAALARETSPQMQDALMADMASRFSFPRERLDELCELIAKDLPSGVDREAFKRDLKLVFRTGLHEFVEKGSTPLDKVIFAEFEKQLEHAIENSPVTSTWWQQAKTNGLAALVVGTFGFGLVAIVMKLVTNYTSIGPNGAHLADLAGPWIAFIVEATIGAIKGGGAGYIALDAAAYQGYDTLKATMARKEKELEGMRANGTIDQGDIENEEEVLASMKTKIQPIVVDLLRREFGHPLGLKRDVEQDDVPVSNIFKCINSGLIVNADREIRIPGEDGPLFRVVRSSSSEVVVEWPNGDETDLLNDPIPADYQEAFEQATELLIDAARGRSRITDDITFLIFGLPFLWNFAGPIMMALGLPGAAVGDTLLMFASSFFGSFMLVFLQNAARSHLMGAPTGFASQAAVTEAKHSSAKVRALVARARLEALRELRQKLAAWIKLGGADVLEHESADRPEQAQASRESITRMRNMQADIKRACKQLVKAKRVAKTEVRRTANVALTTWEGLRASWRALANNPPRLIGKAFGYTLTYIIYSAIWTRIGQAALRPPSMPAPMPTSGNLTEGIFANATTVAAAAKDLSAWFPYATMSALGGWAMGVVFVGRNNPVTRRVEQGLHQVLGYAERYLAGRNDYSQTGDNVTQVPVVSRRDPTRLVGSWNNDPSLLDQGRADQILEVLVAVDPEVLTSRAGLDEALLKVAEELKWDADDIRALLKATTTVTTSWKDWKDRFGKNAEDMQSALNNVAWWSAIRLRHLAPPRDGQHMIPPRLHTAWRNGAEQMNLDSEQIGILLRSIQESDLLNGTNEQVFAAADKLFELAGWNDDQLNQLLKVVQVVLLGEHSEAWRVAWGTAQDDMEQALLVLWDWALRKLQASQ